MKHLFALSFFCSALFAQELPLIQEPPQQEVAILDPMPSLAPPIVLEEPPAQPLMIPLPYRSPFLAATLSAALPGLGHVYLGDMKTGGGLFGTAALGLGASAFFATKSKEFTGPVQVGGALTMQTAWWYGIYAAYRDARLYNRDISYSYQMPMESFTDLALAPFRWSVMKKPEVWGGILGSLAAAIGVSVLSHYVAGAEAHVSLAATPRDLVYFPLVAFPVAIGEEALFRGYVQSQLSELTNPWAGLALSSMAFGAAHITNAIALEAEARRHYYAFSLPLITSLGAYFGWLTQKNHSLKESVAIHAWYDFALMGLAALASQSAASNVPRSFAVAIPF